MIPLYIINREKAIQEYLQPVKYKVVYSDNFAPMIGHILRKCIVITCTLLLIIIVYILDKVKQYEQERTT